MVTLAAADVDENRSVQQRRVISTTPSRILDAPGTYVCYIYEEISRKFYWFLKLICLFMILLLLHLIA